MTINDSRPEQQSRESIESILVESVPATSDSGDNGGGSQDGSTVAAESQHLYHKLEDNDENDEERCGLINTPITFKPDIINNNNYHSKSNNNIINNNKNNTKNCENKPLAPPTMNFEIDYAITPRSVRIGILVATLLENLFFSGIIFGWPALFYMLKSENIYLNLCQIVSKTTKTESLALSDSASDAIYNSTLATILNTTSIPTTTAIATLDNYDTKLHGLDCSRQENILNMAYTIGIFSMGFTSFAWGFMLESYGLRFVRLALNFLISFGCALLCFTTEENSHLIIPAIIILGLIGVPLRIANMQIADFFPRRRSTVITVFSGAFSASPVVFVMLKYGYDQWNLSYFTVMLSLFFLSLLMLPITFCLLPKHSVRNRESKLLTRWDNYRQAIASVQNSDDQRDTGTDARKSPNKPQFINKQKLFTFIDNNTISQKNGKNCGKSGSMLNLFLSNGTKLINGPKNRDLDEHCLNSQELECLNLNLDNNDGNNNNDMKKKNEIKAEIISLKPNVLNASDQTKKPNSFWQIFRGKITKDDIPLTVSLCSLSFLAHQLWFSWLNTYMVLYSGSLALWLARVTDDVETTRNFTQAFGLVQVSALVFAPIAGYIMDRSVRSASEEPDLMKRKLRQAQSGFVPILITTVTLTCAVGCRFFNTPFAVYISIVFITLLRSFLIAVASAYIRVRFPASHFNRLNGIMCTTGAFFSLLQFPLFYFESLSNEYAFYVNVFCAVMTVLSMLNPLCLGITPLQHNLLQSEHEHNEELQANKLRNKTLE